MPTHSEASLERLKKLSQPAIRHQQLVRLARDNTPNQTFALAKELGYPVRQAKASRALAVVRRDFGVSIFESLLVTTEQSQLGHARENRRNAMSSEMSDQFRNERALAHISEPGARLRFMAKKGLVVMVAEQVRVMVRDLPFCFRLDYKGSDILFNTRGSEKDPSDAQKSGHEQTLLCFFADNAGKQLIAVVDIEGLRLFLDWGHMDLRAFLLPAFKRIAGSAIQPSACGRSLEATQILCRRFFDGPMRSGLGNEVELWILRSRLWEGRLFDLPLVALPIPVQKKLDDDSCCVLNPIVDRFVELGWTIEQIKAEFVSWLTARIESCRPQFVLAIAGAKCFEHSDYESGELGTLLRDKYRPEAWKSLVSGPCGGSFWINNYRKLLYCGLRVGFRDEDGFYRREYVKLLSEGKLNRVWQLVLALGSRTLFYAELQENLYKHARQYIEELVPHAFEMAYDAGRYGVAAMLVCQFGKDACYSEQSTKERCNAINAEDRAALDKEFSDVQWKWHNGELENDNPRVLEWQKACEALASKYETQIFEMRTKRKEDIEGVVDLARDLEMPIRFEDMFVYYPAPEWPKC